jgi:hypothetical protein
LLLDGIKLDKANVLVRIVKFVIFKEVPGRKTVVALGEQEWSKMEAARYRAEKIIFTIIDVIVQYKKIMLIADDVWRNAEEVNSFIDTTQRDRFPSRGCQLSINQPFRFGFVILKYLTSLVRKAI